MCRVQWQSTSLICRYNKRGRLQQMQPKKRYPVILLLLIAVLVLAAGPASAQKPNIVVIMGDDIGWFNIGAYHQGMMAGQDAEPRQARRRGHALHRLLRRGELHGRSRRFHHRRVADPHRHDHRRPGWLTHRAARRGDDHCHGAQVHGVCHGPVRQEPPRRSQ